MARRNDVPTRGEFTERTDTSREDMRELEEELETTTDDIETIRQTLEDLEFGGTSEGSDEVESSIEHADDVTVDVFDEHDGSLDDLHGENEELENELQERGDVAESDLGKLSEASAELKTDASVNEFVKPKDAALEDIDFLKVENDRAREAREESHRLQQELQNRAHGSSGG